MPVPPYSWQVNDFLSAWRLNQELYATLGQPFAANGPRWHSMRPIYKSYLLQPPSSISTGTWTQLGHIGSGFNGTWGIVADTAALLGTATDPNLDGTALIGAPNSGGKSGSTGGLGLFSAFPSMVPGTGPVLAGIGTPGSAPASTGTWQQGSANDDITTMAVDIVNMGNIQTGWLNSSQASPQFPISKTDGSGDTARQGMHWVSAYPANGSTVSGVPSLTSSYSLSSQLSSGLLNQNIQQLMNLLNMPPILRVQATASTTQSPSTATTINFPSITGAPNYDTYGKWNSSSNQYTCPLGGLYLIYGCVPQGAGWSGYSKVAANINGTNFYGPPCSANALSSAAAKLGIFNLAAGSTISLTSFQNDTVSHATNQSAPLASLLVVAYLGPTSTFPAFPSAPDTTYAFQAGMSSSSVLSGLNNHMANDLAFLAGRPYLTSSRSAAITGNLVNGIPRAIPMDNISGSLGPNPITQGANGFVNQIPGWYLCVAETQIAAVGTSGGVTSTGFLLGTGGISASDTYQQMFIPDTSVGYGSAALGYYYLRAGETINPVVNLTRGPTTYDIQGNGACHFEMVWLSN